jgi:hypothetical protein
VAAKNGRVGSNARRQRPLLQKARENLDGTPGLPEMYLEQWPEEVRTFAKVREGRGLDDPVALHKKVLREGIEERWRQLRAVELVVGEVAEEFGGEDPALPDVRHMLDHTTDRLVDLHKDAQTYAEPFELPELSEEDVATMRDQVERELEA